tara:strand:+ start:174 stop:287 length:114 start_codon:yes stop_codon:yes gene_type:complete
MVPGRRNTESYGEVFGEFSQIPGIYGENEEKGKLKAD